MKDIKAYIIATSTGEGFPVSVWREVVSGKEHVWLVSDLDIDADGCPNAYNATDSGLDFLANARDSSGRFVGILTDENGTPVKQKEGDPMPGYYISTTSYEWPDQPEKTQRRYVDGTDIPFFVVPSVVIEKTEGAVLGCFATAINTKNGMSIPFAMIGDRGPRTKTGEGSPKAARMLGLSPSPKFGGTDKPIIRLDLYPGRHAMINGRLVPLRKSNGEYIYP